jgi:hypothetical protein
MTLRPGDTLYIPRGTLGTAHDHFYVVASSPASDATAVVLLYITTFEDYKDDACLIQPSDCPDVDFITHLSCVDYREPLIVPLAIILQLLATKRIRLRSAFPEAVLQKVYRGAAESRYAHPAAVTILDRQGCLP